MRWVALVAVFVVAACGSLGVQAHTLSLGFKAGDTYKYKFHATSKQTAGMGGMSFPVEIDSSANESVKVGGVDRSGVADLTITLNDFTLKTVAAGVTNTTSGLPANAVDLKIHSDGTVVSIDGNNLMSGSPLAAFAGVGGGYFIAAVLPPYPVKVGDTWTKTYDEKDPIGTGTIQITSTSKYLRDETVNGINAAVVETNSQGTFGLSSPTTSKPSRLSGGSLSGSFTTDVTTWIDPSGHRVVKSHSTSTDSLSISLPNESPVVSATPQSPFALAGPLTATGQGTADLIPA